MVKTIPKGTHGKLHIPWPVLEKKISRTVTFTPSCRYDLQDVDQLDWNKLFGVGFFPSHHTHSYRYGWRYNKDTDLIDISAYSYQKGQRLMTRIASVKIMSTVEYKIQYENEQISFKLSTGEYHNIPGDWPWLGFELGLYFGGNEVASQEIKLVIK